MGKLLKVVGAIGIFVWMSAWFFGVEPQHDRMALLMCIVIYGHLIDTPQPNGGRIDDVEACKKMGG